MFSSEGEGIEERNVRKNVRSILSGYLRNEMASVPATIPILYQSPKDCNWYSNGIVNWIKIMIVPLPLKVPTVLKKDPKMKVAQAKIFACVFRHRNLTVEPANEKGVWMTPWTAQMR